jgi:hypothetical protein
MAPVDPQAANSLSLGPVLDLIERWQQWVHSDPGYDEDMPVDAERALLAIDVRACRQLAEQHAAQLRLTTEWMSVHVAYTPSNKTASEFMTAAANFLCAPRREPEAE